MGIVIILIILALIFGGIGLIVEGLFWLLVIGLVLLVIGAVMWARARGCPGHGPR
jgi:glucose dehydrogenase